MTFVSIKHVQPNNKCIELFIKCSSLVEGRGCGSRVGGRGVRIRGGRVGFTTTHKLMG